MCGIAGFLTLSSKSGLELEVQVARMASQLRHRGPDDSGIWVDPCAGIALGHRRLSILDLSPEGHQPMLSRSGRYAIVFNGEIYNFPCLRRELEALGHVFCGRSDTEVMLAAIEQWGVERALPHLNGMFTFGVWDRNKRQLHLVRDRLGEKPLYYGWMGKSFLFGSELKALVAHSDFQGDIDRSILPLYLRHSCIPQPYSVYRGIYKLPPATRLTLKRSGEHTSLTATPYWSAEDAARRGMENPFRGSAEEALRQLDELLRDAVKMRMTADVPLGAFLSGGVDSSTIVALMQMQSPRAVKTFSLGFHEGSYDEAKNAAAVAHHLGTDHTEFYVSPEDAMRVIPLLPTLYDEPFSDSSQIPTYLVSMLARQHVTVSLSGDGGDELFGGYKRYFLWGGIWNLVTWMPPRARVATSRVLRRFTPQRWNSLAGFLPAVRPDSTGDKIHRLAGLLSAEDAFGRYQALVSACESPTTILQESAEPVGLLHSRCQGPAFLDFRRHMMFMDLVTFLPDDILVKVDRASMAVGLEMRAPYLDHRLVEFAARLPIRAKLRHGKGKWLLRRVLRQYVPKRLIEGPKKGFAVPIAEWLRGPLRDWAEELLGEDRLRREGYFRPRPVRRLWDEHVSGQRNLEHQIWGLLMFQAWLAVWRKKSIDAVEIPRGQLFHGSKPESTSEISKLVN